jgi:hypothetical protein
MTLKIPAIEVNVERQLPDTTNTVNILRDAGTVDGVPVGGSSLTDNSVTFAKMQDIATDTLIGRDTAGTGDPESITLNTTLSMTGAQALQRAALTGDATASAGSNAVTLVQASSAFAFTGDISPTSIGSSQNDYNPTGLSTASTLRLTSSGTFNITGLSGGADGRLIIIHNIGSSSIILIDESASSSAANRFALIGDITLNADSVGIFQYDSTSSRWRSLGNTGVTAGAGGITSLNALTGATQTFATGTAGTDFAISSSGTTHTFNIPSAAAGVRGLVSIATQTFEGGKSIAAAGTAPNMTFSPGGSATAIFSVSCAVGWTNNASSLLGTADAVLTRAAASVIAIQGASSEGGTVRFLPNIATQITADKNNYGGDSGGTSGRAGIQRWSSDASRNITGLAPQGVAGVSGQIHIIANVGSFDIVLVNQSASSTAANRFLNSTGADITLTPDQGAFTWYDATTARWRVYKMN